MEEKVYEVLKNLNVNYSKIDHPPLYTAMDNEQHGIKFDGIACKNLFLRNKDKSQYYLIILPLNKRLDLKNIQNKLNETRLSFGNEDELAEKLKITRGAVSLLNIIEVEKTDIKFIIDRSLLDYDNVCFHPNINTSTVIFSSNTIKKILDKYKADYKFIEF